MEREDLFRNSGYITTKIQLDLYRCAEDFMSKNKMNRTQLAKYLGVSKGYVSQLLSGDYDHKLSKLVELALAFDMVPSMEFKPIEEAVSDDKHRFEQPKYSRIVEYREVYRNKSNFRFVAAKTYETALPMSNRQKRIA